MKALAVAREDELRFRDLPAIDRGPRAAGEGLRTARSRRLCRDDRGTIQSHQAR